MLLYIGLYRILNKIPKYYFQLKLYLSLEYHIIHVPIKYTFLYDCRFFLQAPANPDLLYLVLFIHTQLTTTVTLAFLFGSKVCITNLYLLYSTP